MSQNNLLMLHWRDLKPSPSNRLVRGEIDPDDPRLKELATSIRARGVIQPLTVIASDGDGYTILAGERRWRAVKSLNGLAPLLPCVVRESSDKAQILLDMGTENIQRENLAPLAEARYYRALLDGGLPNVSAIARELGKTRTHIEGRLALLEFSPAVQALFESGGLKLGAAKILTRLPLEIRSEAAMQFRGRALVDIDAAVKIILADRKKPKTSPKPAQNGTTKRIASQNYTSPPKPKPDVILGQHNLTLAVRATCAACEVYPKMPDIRWDAVADVLDTQCDSCPVNAWQDACEQCPLVDFLKALKKVPGNSDIKVPAHLQKMGVMA